jgi:hypothetical protein
MSLPDTTERWSALVTDLRRSGLSIREFAARHDVNAKTLGWCLTKLRHAPVSPRFVEVRLAPAAPTVLRLSFTTLPMSLEVPVGTDLEWLRQVVGALT